MLSGDTLDAEVLRRELVRPGGLWSGVDVVARTGSTNADLAARARTGAPAGAVLVTDFQDAGRGRQGRSWVAPRGSSVAMSVLLRPRDVDPGRWTWLPLLAGLAVVEGLRRAADVPAVLKWPNDVLVDGQKICGILAERVETPAGPACVVGMGINVWLAADELPVPTATSLTLAGSTVDRTVLLRALLEGLHAAYGAWRDGSPRDRYLALCDTVGREVRVELPRGVLEGTAVDVDADGALVVASGGRHTAVTAGDVVHLRPS